MEPPDLIIPMCIESHHGGFIFLSNFKIVMLEALFSIDCFGVFLNIFIQKASKEIRLFVSKK